MATEIGKTDIYCPLCSKRPGSAFKSVKMSNMGLKIIVDCKECGKKSTVIISKEE